MDNFEFIYSEFNSYLNDYENIFIDMFHFMLAYSFELNSGNSDVSNFRDIEDSNDYTSRGILSGMYKDNDEYKGVLRFNKKYFINHFKMFFKVIEIFVREGVLKKELFVNEIDQYIKEVERSRKPMYYLLLSDNYKEMSNEDFISISNDTYELILNGEIIFYHYYYAFIMYRKFIEARLFLLSEDKMLKDFIEGLDKSLAKSSYIDNERLQRQLQIDIKEDNALVVIREKIISINNELSERRQKKLALDTLNSLRHHDIKSFLNTLDEQFTSISFFSFIRADLFFESILLLTNENLNKLINSINNKYFPNFKMHLNSDLTFFNELRKIINEYLIGKNITLKNHILIEFSTSIEKNFGMEINK